MQNFCIDYHFGDNSVTDIDTDVPERYSGGAMSGGQMSDYNVSGLNSNIPCHRYTTLGSRHYHSHSSRTSGFIITCGCWVEGATPDEAGIFEVHTPDQNVALPNVGSQTHSIGHTDLI